MGHKSVSRCACTHYSAGRGCRTPALTWPSCVGGKSGEHDDALGECRSTDGCHGASHGIMAKWSYISSTSSTRVRWCGERMGAASIQRRSTRRRRGPGSSRQKTAPPQSLTSHRCLADIETLRVCRPGTNRVGAAVHATMAEDQAWLKKCDMGSVTG